MFYSHTFLARKGALGTVWCAAHLQHKLKKSHYISTNVKKTAEMIMCPEVPIALRMSGHLLLGVVRIYSKQVDYLYEDCNETRITINRIFTTVSVNLPDDATHAPVHAITLPGNFNLDAMELDDFAWGDDSHLKNKDDITLAEEQIPTGIDPYIVFSFNEVPTVEENSGSGVDPMEEDAPPIGSEKAPPDVEYPSPSNTKGPGHKIVGDGSIEHVREALHGFDFNNSPILPNRIEADDHLVEQINKDEEINTQVTKGAVSPDEHHSLPEEQHSSGHMETPVPSGGANENIKSTYVAPDHSTELKIRPSPARDQQSPQLENQPNPPVQPRPRRKRKRYDTSTVLTNSFMRDDMLGDTSDIRRVIRRRNCSSPSLAIRKQNREQYNRERLRKEGLFVEPFITGISADLHGIYKEDSAKHHLVSTEAPPPETDEVQPPNNIEPETDEVQPPNNIEPEIDEVQPPNNVEPETDPNNIEPEIQRINECITPVIPVHSTIVPICSTPGKSNEELQPGHLEMDDSEIPSRVDGASGYLDSEIGTPDASYGKYMEAEDEALPVFPGLVASPGELGFLEQDDNSPAMSQGTPATGDFSKNKRTMEMSSRTRAVAQYLERQSVTPLPGNSEGPEDLSLKKILEGKTRKVCARMFYETLVLKSLGLVDAQQERPYGDITLKVTHKLSKGKFPV
ncbi:hypothetical protein ACS0TY_003296 [Phlomoides rotata]